MKFTPVFALLAACAPFVAHAQTDDAPAVAAMAPLPMAPKSAATADSFVWRFEPPVGSRWTMRSFARATSNTQTPAMDGQKARSLNFKMMQKMTFDYDVLSRDALGATTIRLTLREMTNDLTLLSNGKITNPPGAKKVDPKAVDGATLTMKQARDGNVWGVVGLRAFQRKMLEASGALDAATINQVLDNDLTTGDNKQVNSMSMMAGTLPTSPVRTGESWNYSVMLPAPLAFQITGTRTLKSLSSEFAVVADSALYQGGKSQMKMPDMPAMKGYSVDYSQLQGSVNGVSRVQRASGLPLESTVNQTLTGKITTLMPAMNGTPAQKITLPLDVTSSTRVVMEPRLDNSDPLADQ